MPHRPILFPILMHRDLGSLPFPSHPTVPSTELGYGGGEGLSKGEGDRPRGDE